TPLERPNEIAAGQQSRDADSRSPELALNGDGLQIHTETIDALLQVRIKDLAGAHRVACATGGFLSEGGAELSKESSHHPDTIFDLRKIRIVAGRRKLVRPHDVDLVAQKSKRRPDATLEFSLKWRDVSNQFSRVIAREWRQFRQVLPMVRQTYGHDRERCNARMKLQ